MWVIGRHPTFGTGTGWPEVIVAAIMGGLDCGVAGRLSIRRVTLRPPFISEIIDEAAGNRTHAGWCWELSLLPAPLILAPLRRMGMAATSDAEVLC
jgi:hypothetical protein